MEQLFLPLLLMLVVAVPLIMGTRKQKKAVAQQQELQSSLSAGDRVMTTSGLYATVADASDETTIDLEIADGVTTTWLRQAVREKIEITADDADDVDVLDNDNEIVADDAAVTPTTVDEDDRERAEASTSTGASVAPPLEHGKK
ncbi:preprotein translocase subunit YajC [Amycolatopsis antarctica]|uniref:Preprotein translocase subunit YajC n=1 Tax=Amycolatopsis antarctica TaxID=1854586 RepID=A0A263D262_9PSEU|nr:preprotein translocase subunit YajC [Amycolatopsis antarctica]OZM72441.1 preprotein translocase subunit YajC [Amycolatopsis antarctica]